MTHKSARQYNDQMTCSHCGKSWDVNDPDPPECESVPATSTRLPWPPVTPSASRTSGEWIAYLRSIIKNK